VVGIARLVRWRPATAADLTATGYPNPQGELYFVADLEFVERLPTWVGSIDLELLTTNVRNGAPLVVTWWDVIHAASTVEH
jgi:hypothetical protein